MIIRELSTISKANKKRNYQKSNCVRIVKKVKSVPLYITLTTQKVPVGAAVIPVLGG